MTMIDRDVTPNRRLDEAIGRLEARDSSVTKPRASCTYEPKHRADVEPAVVQCCGECVTCNVCGEPIT